MKKRLFHLRDYCKNSNVDSTAAACKMPRDESARASYILIDFNSATSSTSLRIDRVAATRDSIFSDLTYI